MLTFASAGAGAVVFLFIGMILLVVSKIGRTALPPEERRALDRREARARAGEKKAMGCLWTIAGLIFLAGLIGMALSR